MKDNTNYILFSILRSLFNGNPMNDDDKSLVTDESLAEVIGLASKHDIAHLVALGLLNNKLVKEERKQQLLQIIFHAIYRYEKLNNELKQVSAAFKKAKIQFVPLKGAVLREYYPEPWMRTSCDIDVLVHENDLERAVSVLLSENKYVSDKKKNYHDISLHSPSGVNLELHFNIQEDIESIDKVLTQVWQYTAASSELEYKYEMTNEYLIFHILAHMSYHFVSGGCGIRPIMDLWLLENVLSIDENILTALLSEAKLLKFYKSVKILSTVWFGEDDHTETSKQMEDYILLGGVYGTLQNRVLVQQQKNQGKYTYAFHRIFIPYNKLKHLYPKIKKHRWLLPFAQVHRWFKIVFDGRAKHSIQELSYNNNITKFQSDEIKVFLDKIGL